MASEYAAPALLRYASTTFRRAAILGGGCGGLAVIGLAVFGRPLAALLGCLGLGLGALNAYLMHRSLLGLATQGAQVSRKRVAMSSLSRLGAITVVAVAFAALVRPDGIAVFAGLAFFQVVMAGSAAIPGLKEARKP